MEKQSEKLSSILRFCECRIRSRILSAKLRLSLRSKALTPRKENYEWSVLKSDQELQNRYSIQLHNRFFILQNELTDNIDDKYQHFKLLRR